MNSQKILDIINQNGLHDRIFQDSTFYAMLIVALLYGILLNLLYRLYFRANEPLDASLSRSLVLLTPTVMTIFWIVQYSLPLSVGLLGTLSFVRFRAPVKRAEDISFIVISLACAISCAIKTPVIGLMLILILVLYAIVRNHLLPFQRVENNFAVLTYNTQTEVSVPEIEKIIKQSSVRNYEFVSSRTYDGITSFVFNIVNLNKVDLTFITRNLEKKDNNCNINVFYPNGRLGAEIQ